MRKWNDEFFRSNNPAQKIYKDEHDVHHIFEKQFQRIFEIPENELDNVPGFVMERRAHQELVAQLTRELGRVTDKEEIIRGVQRIYRQRGYHEMWEATRKWLMTNPRTAPYVP